MSTEPAIPPHRCASFWKRLFAYGYDSLIVLILSTFVAWMLGTAAHAQTPQELQTLIDAGLLPPDTNFNDPTALLSTLAGLITWKSLIIPIIISAFYNIFFLTGSWQATPGKRFCDIHVVNLDGSRISLIQSVLRHLTSAISMAPLGLPYLTIFFTPEKLAVHDMICRTRVVLGKTSN